MKLLLTGFVSLHLTVRTFCWHNNGSIGRILKIIEPKFDRFTLGGFYSRSAFKNKANHWQAEA